MPQYYFSKEAIGSNPEPVEVVRIVTGATLTFFSRVEDYLNNTCKNDAGEDARFKAALNSWRSEQEATKTDVQPVEGEPLTPADGDHQEGDPVPPPAPEGGEGGTEPEPLLPEGGEQVWDGQSPAEPLAPDAGTPDSGNPQQ